MAEFKVEVTLPHNHYDGTAWKKVGLNFEENYRIDDSMPDNFKEAHNQYIKDLEYLRDKTKERSREKPLGGKIGSGDFVSDQQNEWFWEHTILEHQGDGNGEITMSVAKFSSEGSLVNFIKSRAFHNLLADYDIGMSSHVKVYKDGAQISIDDKGNIRR